MPRKAKTQGAPPEGGSVQSAEPGSISDSVMKMTGFQSADEMRDSLPESTMSSGEPTEERTRRPRRSKEEMLRAKGKNKGAEEIDPLMQDPRYKKAVESMRSAGITTTIVGGFDTVAQVTKDQEWKLDEEEFQKVDDFSYVCSKKFPLLDPTGHWLAMALYFMALMGTLIFKRAAKMHGESWMKQLTEMFGFGEEEKTAQELENEKAASV